MIRRILNIFFLLNFVVATTGLSVTSHTCDMSKCKAAFICSGKADCKCCKTTIKYHRLTNDFSLIKSQEKIESPVTDLFILVESILSVKKNENAIIAFADTSPPILKGELSFLQEFRI